MMCVKDENCKPNTRGSSLISMGELLTLIRAPGCWGEIAAAEVFLAHAVAVKCMYSVLTAASQDEVISPS